MPLALTKDMYQNGVLVDQLPVAGIMPSGLTAEQAQKAINSQEIALEQKRKGVMGSVKELGSGVEVDPMDAMYIMNGGRK